MPQAAASFYLVLQVCWTTSWLSVSVPDFKTSDVIAVLLQLLEKIIPKIFSPAGLSAVTVIKGKASKGIRKHVSATGRHLANRWGIPSEIYPRDAQTDRHAHLTRSGVRLLPENKEAIETDRPFLDIWIRLDPSLPSAWYGDDKISHVSRKGRKRGGCKHKDGKEWEKSPKAKGRPIRAEVFKLSTLNKHLFNLLGVLGYVLEGTVQSC